jgi:predicted component of type VI protein secretion system
VAGVVEAMVAMVVAVVSYACSVGKACRQETLLQFELLTADLVLSGLAPEQQPVEIQISKLVLQPFFKQMADKLELDGAHHKTRQQVVAAAAAVLEHLVEMVD